MWVVGHSQHCSDTDVVVVLVWVVLVWTVRGDSSSAAAQGSVGHPLVLHQWSQDAAPQDAAPQDAAPQDTAPQDSAPQDADDLQSTMSDEAGPSGHSQSHSQSQTQSQPSSSSSGPTSASQSSSGSGTLSSVDTVPTADLSSIPEEPEEPEPKYWGRMVPLIRGFNVHNCVESSYSFGRDSRCDYAFKDPIVMESPRYKTYSKKHFRIFRKLTGQNSESPRLIKVVVTFRLLQMALLHEDDGSINPCGVSGYNPSLQGILLGTVPGKASTTSGPPDQFFDDGKLVYLEDLSGNGTWVDDVEVGKSKKLPLNNNSVVSLADPKHKVFMYVDMTDDDQPNFPKEFRDKYHVTRKIGSGVCGEVRLAIERETCKKVALKTINKNDFPSIGTATRNAEREIEILKKIDHPCLIRTEDFYQTEDSYYIVLEYVEGGELFSRIKTEKQLKENIAKLYFYQMLKAVEYLHENGIIHRDLKPENVLLTSHDDECLIKITDFNQSKILEESSLMKTLCGTPTYLAPEVFTAASTGGYTRAVDSWSLGVLLFICLGGYPPFNPESSSMPVRDQIMSGHYCFIRSQWHSVSNNAKDLVKKLLVVDPAKRLGISEALQHPWLKFGDGPFLFQHDRTPVHRASSIKTWRSESGVEELDWPAQSPDLHPIEHLWDGLEWRLRARPSRPTSMSDLTDVLLEEWSEIPIITFLTLWRAFPEELELDEKMRETAHRLMSLGETAGTSQPTEISAAATERPLRTQPARASKRKAEEPAEEAAAKRRPTP
ncbi:hypothetical protein NFI96_031873 [Prochilodus magdalenae]|nr:hypothetical protein NFI96_031873 [Prochilodus magdalenae]